MKDLKSILSGEVPCLISTDDWFRCSDGEEWKSVWGKVRVATAEDVLGFTPSGSGSTNWFAIVDDRLIIAGCKIHFAAIAPRRPKNMRGTLDLGPK